MLINTFGIKNLQYTTFYNPFRLAQQHFENDDSMFSFFICFFRFFFFLHFLLLSTCHYHKTIYLFDWLHILISCLHLKSFDREINWYTYYRQIPLGIQTLGFVSERNTRNSRTSRNSCTYLNIHAGNQHCTGEDPENVLFVEWQTRVSWRN